jgi:two-component system OmpR family sensor kinase
VSLRLRLVLALGCTVLVALAAANVAVYTAFRSSLIATLDSSLNAAAQPIQRLVSGQLPGSPDDDANTPPPIAARGGSGGASTARTSTAGPASSAAPNDEALGTSFCLHAGGQLGAGTVVELRSATGALVSGSSCVGGASLTSAATPVLTGASPVGTTATTGPLRHFSTTSRDGTIEYRVSETVLPGGTVLVVAARLDATDRALSKLLVEELVTSIFALLLAIALGFWLVRVGLRPLRDVERAAEAITEGDLSLRVPGEETRTEVGSVARAINTMLRRIEDAFRQRDATERALRSSEERLRQFVADASHELRTPIAAVSAYAELFGTGAGEPAHRADLERVMSGIKGESDRMRELVEDLLLLARLDEGRALEPRPVELVALCSDAIRTSIAVGPAWPIDLEASEPVELLGDPAKLRQVIDNLLYNVRAHTPEGTRTKVRVTSDGTEGTIEVSDDGPGFQGADVDRVFERFYRADPSRTRARGGSGLGLSIVASIIEGHSGTVRAQDREPHGATITVSLPIFLP